MYIFPITQLVFLWGNNLENCKRLLRLTLPIKLYISQMRANNNHLNNNPVSDDSRLRVFTCIVVSRLDHDLIILSLGSQVETIFFKVTLLLLICYRELD